MLMLPPMEKYFRTAFNFDENVLSLQRPKKGPKSLRGIMTLTEFARILRKPDTIRDQDTGELLEIFSRAVHGHGVEVIRGTHSFASPRHYWQDIALEYVNMGDTYEDTLLYDPNLRKFGIASWGDWVEAYGERRGV